MIRWSKRVESASLAFHELGSSGTAIRAPARTCRPADPHQCRHVEPVRDRSCAQRRAVWRTSSAAKTTRPRRGCCPPSRCGPSPTGVYSLDEEVAASYDHPAVFAEHRIMHQVDQQAPRTAAAMDAIAEAEVFCLLADHHGG